MEQKLEEAIKENNEEAVEYFKFIKSSVDDGSYFKDAQDWYFFRYISPICDRTLLIFGALIAAVVLYWLTEMVQGMFPLVQKTPIFIRSVDQANYFPDLIGLKPKKGTAQYDPMVVTVDEAVAKYLLSTYIKEREGYDFSQAEIEDVNTKFNRIKNVSSAAEYRAFQAIMSKDNPTSPILDFGLNVKKTIVVESVQFIKKEPQDFTAKAKNFLSSAVPTEAEIRFLATTKKRNIEDGTASEEKERYVAKINFTFGGVNKTEKKENINFIVNSYQLFKVN
jgi:type IV secretory pathway component VirB8